MKNKKDYKHFCEENNLRYALDACADPISPTKRRLYDDHLYWTGAENVGVYIGRPTRTKYNNMKKKLLALGCVESQGGDTEGNFIVNKELVRDVAALIGANKNNVSEKNRERMRQRMKERWKNKRGNSHEN